LHTQQFDQAIIDPRRFDPKADQTADSLVRADRQTAIGYVALAQANERVTREQVLICKTYLKFEFFGIFKYENCTLLNWRNFWGAVNVTTLFVAC
jgi:limonene-1,2-epoxide hydrolase